MAKEKITGAEALMRSLEHEGGLRRSSAIRAELSCRYMTPCTDIKIS